MSKVKLLGQRLSDEEVKRRIKKRLKEGKEWGKTQTHKICKSCKGQCCYQSIVVLDREAVERRLHEFSGEYDYSYPNHNPTLAALGRKNTQVPVLKRREDGSCIFFDWEKRRCTIYRRRPAACKSFFCGRGTGYDLPWRGIRQREKARATAEKVKKNREAKLRSIEKMKKWKPDRELPMLDALLGGKKLWNSGAPATVQKRAMQKVMEQIREEHNYMCDHEPQDQFHVCVLLGALNLIDGLLSKQKVLK